jgi:hypothetical protein
VLATAHLLGGLAQSTRWVGCSEQIDGRAPAGPAILVALSSESYLRWMELVSASFTSAWPSLFPVSGRVKYTASEMATMTIM